MTTNEQALSGPARPATAARPRLLPTRLRTAFTGRHLAAVALAALLLGSAYLLSLNSLIELNRRVLALAIIWLGCIPTFAFLLNPRRPPIPFFPLVGLFYASNFGFPVFIAEDQAIADNQPHIDEVTMQSLWLIFLGMLCLMTMYYVGSVLLRRWINPIQIKGDFLSLRFRSALWVYLFAYLFYRGFPYLKAIPSLGTLFNALAYLSFGVLFQWSMTGRLSLPGKLLLWLVFVPVEVVYRLSSGSIADTMIFAIFFSLIASRVAPKFALAAFAAGVLALVIFSPVKNTFRLITWNNTANNSGPVLAYQKCLLLFELAYDYHIGGEQLLPGGYGQQTTVTSVAGRLSSVTLLSMVVERTPSVVPYWDGQSYLPLLTKPIPRALWPGKPQEDIGNEFGHRYLLLADADDLTSLNLPWIVELFANFGTIGLLVGMGLIGIALACLNQIFNFARSNSPEFVTGAALLMQLFYQESSFSLMIGQALLLYIALRIALKIALPASAQRQLPITGRTQPRPLL